MIVFFIWLFMYIYYFICIIYLYRYHFKCLYACIYSAGYFCIYLSFMYLFIHVYLFIFKLLNSCSGNILKVTLFLKKKNSIIGVARLSYVVHLNSYGLGELVIYFNLLGP